MKFDLGTLLSITDGRLMTDMDNVYKITEFVCNAPGVMTVGLVVLAD